MHEWSKASPLNQILTISISYDNILFIDKDPQFKQIS